MNCQMFVDLLDDFVDLALAPADRQRMEEHLRTCSNCRKELEDLQSLLARSAELREKPQRDLWPQIETGINMSGIPQTASAEQAVDSSFPVRTFRFIWRLAAAAILGTMILLAATYFRNRLSAPVSGTVDEKHTGDIGTSPNTEPSDSKNKQNMRQDLVSRQSESNDFQPGVSAGNYEEACQCGPSEKISGLIDRASIVDESLPGMRAREAVSERLYVLAGENADDFFLHKASLENSLFPLPAASSTAIRRYLSKLAQRPNDPVWTYLYASSLFGKNTQEMIRLMRQLVTDHPEFPWPNLSLAKVYGLFDFKDEMKARSHLQSFMKLCPESPEPLRILVSFGDSDFLSGTVRRMRLNLITHSDIQSLLLYQNLWYLETIRRATDDDPSKTQKKIREDLKRLEALESTQQDQLAAVIRSGYRQIDDVATFGKLFERDTSWSGRWGVVMLKIQEWNRENPVPPTDAPSEKRTAYWESRLRLSESLIGKMPESPSLWMIKLEALASLKNHSQSEFLEGVSNVLALERDGAETPELGTHLSWKSNLLKLASLCSNQGLFLDQIPALIREGYVAAESHNYENSTDLLRNPQWVSLMSRFGVWIEANDAWHSLADAYLRSGKTDKASDALDSIEAELKEFKRLLAQALANARPDDGVTVEVQRKSMADRLARLEERYTIARASVRQAARK